MVTLRLFHVDNPFRPLDERDVDAAPISVGRDPSADWCISDAACELSRRHCTIAFEGDRLRVKDTSVNGVFVGRPRRRLAAGVEVEVPANESVQLGQFLITAEWAEPANEDATGEALDAPFHAPMMRDIAATERDIAIESDWRDAGPRDASARAFTDAELLEAFCAGAGLEPALLVGEHPAEVLRRAGAVYRQSVLGLSDLMGERTSVKGAYRLDRTTIASAGNNPFKWADAHAVAIDLLRSDVGPFLNEAGAVREAFRDVKKHLLCLVAGARTAVAASIEHLAPSQVETTPVGGQLLESKAARNWRQFAVHHAALKASVEQNSDSVVNAAFKAGYEQQLRKLDGMDETV